MRVHCNPLPPDARFTQREGGEGRRKGWRESRNDNLGEGRKGRGGGGETSLLYAFIKLLYIDHTGQINLVPLESPRVSEGLSMALLQGRMSTEFAKKKKKKLQGSHISSRALFACACDWPVVYSQQLFVFSTQDDAAN